MIRFLKFTGAALIVFAAFSLTFWLVTLIRVDHWGYAISVNFLFMAAFTFIFGALFSPHYSSRYFSAKPLERNGSIYRWLGVRYYSQLLKLIGWERVVRKDQLVRNDLGSLKRLTYATRGAEAAHLAAAICVAAVTAWVALEYTLVHISWLVVINVITNIYPMMLQRHNRPRIDRLIQKKEKPLRRTQPNNCTSE